MTNIMKESMTKFETCKKLNTNQTITHDKKVYMDRYLPLQTMLVKEKFLAPFFLMQTSIKK